MAGKKRTKKPTLGNLAALAVKRSMQHPKGGKSLLDQVMRDGKAIRRGKLPR